MGPQHFTTRSRRPAASSWRYRAGTTFQCELPKIDKLIISDPSELLPLAGSPREALRSHLLFALFAPCDQYAQRAQAAANADELLELHGWPLPPLARREGGLWLLSAATIESLRSDAARSGRAKELRAPYELSAFAPLYDEIARGKLEDLCAGDVLCRGHTLPSVDLGHAPSSSASSTQLPPRAAQLLKQEMACVLRRAGLFPPGVQRWGRSDFLLEQLKQRCHTLVSSAKRKRFKYWRDETDLRTADRVPGGYEFTPPVHSENLSVCDFFVRSSQARHDECVYLQQNLLAPDPHGRLAPTGPIGEQMAADIAGGLNSQLLSQIAQAACFGRPERCQLFVGANAAAHARTQLHFDQYDNCFMQLSGRKTFLLFDPLQSGRIYPYPIHHPLDRSAQLDLEESVAVQQQPAERRTQGAAASSSHSASGSSVAGGGGFPRLREARGCVVTLEPGDVLVLPAYWWHEVITEPNDNDSSEEGGGGGRATADQLQLTVSLNLWFNPTHRLLQPTLPLSPMMRVELSRQLEFLICDALGDRPALVPRFCAALADLVDGRCTAHASPAHRSSASAHDDGCESKHPAYQLWTRLAEGTPEGVDSDNWLGLLEYVGIKLAHILGGHQVAPFVHDMMSAERFAGLEATRTRPPGVPNEATRKSD